MDFSIRYTGGKGWTWVLVGFKSTALPPFSQQKKYDKHKDTMKRLLKKIGAWLDAEPVNFDNEIDRAAERWVQWIDARIALAIEEYDRKRREAEPVDKNHHPVTINIGSLISEAHFHVDSEQGIKDMESKLIDALLRVANTGARAVTQN
jgi:hypothetical protein